MTLLPVPRVQQGLLQARRLVAPTFSNPRAHPAQASPTFPAVAAPSSWSFFSCRLSFKLAGPPPPGMLLSSLCPLLGEAAGPSREGSAFTASPRLSMICREPGVLCHLRPVNCVHALYILVTPSLPRTPILGYFFLNSFEILIQIWLPKTF